MLTVGSSVVPTMMPPLQARGVAEVAPRFGKSKDVTVFQPAPTILFVVNPKSGRAMRYPYIDALPATLAKLNVKQPYEIVPIDQFKLALMKHHDSLDRVVAIGGDGTVSSVIEAVSKLDKPVKVGIVPMGTGNLLARNLGLPRDLKRSLDVALGEKSSPLDVAKFNGQRFTVMAGVGLDAAMIKDSEGTLSKEKLGKWAYYAKGLQQLVNPQIRDFTITADGQTFHVRGLGVTISNTRNIVGTMALAPQASHHDGLLDVTVLGVTGFSSLLKSSLQALFQQSGTLDDKTGLMNIQAKNVTVTWDKPLESQVDGEITAPTTRIDAGIAQTIAVLTKKSA